MKFLGYLCENCGKTYENDSGAYKCDECMAITPTFMEYTKHFYR